jgi:glycosyltransferase involved in cell wall biosynthesis
MHILMIPSWYPLDQSDINGIFFRDYAFMLKDDGFRVGIVSPQLISLRDRQRLLKIASHLRIRLDDDSGIPIVKFAAPNIPSTLKPAYYKMIGYQLYQKYRELHGEPDLIFAQSCLWAGVTAKYLSGKFSVPYFITEHNSRFLGNGTLNSLELKSIRSAFNSASAVVCVSDALSNSVRNLLLVKRDIITIHNPVTVEIDKLTIHPQRRGLICVASLNKNKQIDKIIEAFYLSELKSRENLIIIGDGPERDTLEKLSANLGLSGKIIFLGKLSRSEVYYHMSRSSIFISASKIETFGISIIEAFINGLPVVSTQSGGPNSTINSINGLLSESDDPRILSRLIDRIDVNINSYDRALISQNSRELYSKFYIAERYRDLIEKVMEKMGKDE